MLIIKYLLIVLNRLFIPMYSLDYLSSIISLLIFSLF